MIEKQSINGKDVWLKVDSQKMDRPNPNVIPTEYFTAAYYFEEPHSAANGETIRDENGEIKLFESPVAALSYAWKKLETIV